jgi:hypothetical protein
VISPLTPFGEDKMKYASSIDGPFSGQSIGQLNSCKPEAPMTVFDGIHELFMRLSSMASYAEIVEQKLNGPKPEDASSQGLRASADGILPKLRNAAGDASVEIERIHNALRAIDKAISG